MNLRGFKNQLLHIEGVGVATQEGLEPRHTNYDKAASTRYKNKLL